MQVPGSHPGESHPGRVTRGELLGESHWEGFCRAAPINTTVEGRRRKGWLHIRVWTYLLTEGNDLRLILDFRPQHIQTNKENVSIQFLVVIIFISDNSVESLFCNPGLEILA